MIVNKETGGALSDLEQFFAFVRRQLEIYLNPSSGGIILLEEGDIREARGTNKEIHCNFCVFCSTFVFIV
jgi:hypothetical protein